MSQPTNHADQPDGNSKNFEKTYLALRKAEGSLLNDADVARQPKYGFAPKMASRLIAHLKRKKRPLQILEIGCGSGAFAAKLASISNVKVLAIDVVSTEIEQAKRVFKEDNLDFLTASIFDDALQGKTFDAIIFAGSMPFVPKGRDVLKKAITMLNAKGEIHVADIPLYHDRQVMAAAQRARDQYESLKVSEMAKFHHHYSMDLFRELNYRVMVDPRRLLSRLTGDKTFWVKINR